QKQPVGVGVAEASRAPPEPTGPDHETVAAEMAATPAKTGSTEPEAGDAGAAGPKPKTTQRNFSPSAEVAPLAPAHQPAPADEELPPRVLVQVKVICGDPPAWNRRSPSPAATCDSSSPARPGTSIACWMPASYFCLRNDHWQFIAMDTGLDSHDLLDTSSTH